MILSFIVTCVFVVIDNYIVSFKGIHLRLFYECAPFFIWLVYPVMGYFIYKNGRDYNCIPWLVVLLVSLVACFFESKWLYGMKGEGLGVTKISAVVFSCSAIMVLFSNKVQQALREDGVLFKGLSYIGEISFGIYLIHKYFIEYLFEPIIGDTLVLAGCTLLISVLFIQIIKVLIPKPFTIWFGFR